MKELKCPKCGNVFTVDEADYASIVSQVRNAEFESELGRRLEEFRQRQAAEQRAKEVESRELYIKQLQSKNLLISGLQNEISRSKAEKENAVLRTRDEFKDVIGRKEQEIAELRNSRTLVMSQAELEKNSIREEYEAKLKIAQEQVDYYKDMKIRMSTKMVGESLEAHCSNIFNGSMRHLIPNA